MNAIPLLLDHSAWARLQLPSLSHKRASQIADAFEERALAVCLPFLLEAGYSARSAQDHGRLLSDLIKQPFLSIDRRVEDRTLDAQAQLARAGHHRVPPLDVVIAALADRHDHGILHYDADYDLIAERTDLKFEGVWLAERGTL